MDSMSMADKKDILNKKYVPGHLLIHLEGLNCDDCSSDSWVKVKLESVENEEK